MEHLEDFKMNFVQSGLNIFVKAHMVTHIEDYLHNILDVMSGDEFLNPGLAWTSEQAIESSHHHFKETWSRYKKCPKNKNALKLAVIDFNYNRFITAFSD